MQDRVAVWDVLTDENSVEPRNAAQRKAIERFNDVILSLKCGWTQEDIAQMSVEYYRDTLTIMSMINAKQRKKK